MPARRRSWRTGSSSAAPSFARRTEALRTRSRSRSLCASASTAPDMRTFLTAYARAVGATGLAILIAALLLDPHWRAQPLTILVIAVAAFFVRIHQIPLTKYGALNLMLIPAVSGALLAGGSASALGVWIGVFVADAVPLRKGAEIAWINAGRDVIALLSAYGVFAWASVSVGADVTRFSAESLPALALLLFAYFLVSRLLLYFTLLLRDKLLDEEKSLILRYEVIGFGASTIAVSIIILAVANLNPIGWGIVSLVHRGIGLLVKRILEESISAEESNKILAMEQIVSSTGDISDAFRRIEALAHRLVDWSDFRIGRIDDGQLMHVFRGNEGYFASPRQHYATLANLRRERLRTGDVLRVNELLRDDRILPGRSDTRSILVLPLRFGDRLVGMLKLEHHKPDPYTDKEARLMRRFASQLATTMHIYDLRRPLLEAMTRVSSQLQTLTASARALRGSGQSLARIIAEISRGIAEEGEQVGRSIEVTTSLHAATLDVVRDGGAASAASH